MPDEPEKTTDKVETTERTTEDTPPGQPETTTESTTTVEHTEEAPPE